MKVVINVAMVDIPSPMKLWPISASPAQVATPTTTIALTPSWLNVWKSSAQKWRVMGSVPIFTLSRCQMM